MKSKILSLLHEFFFIHEKPLTIQMPITSRCNSRCKTCNVWKYKENIDIDAKKLEIALNDEFFSEVICVGLNGGEFTLVPNFLDIIDAVLTLPKILSIYLISNGLFPQRLFEYTSKAYERCKTKGVYLHLCLSVDGVGEVHNLVRGIPNCFNKTKEILDTMQQYRNKYCDGFSVGCTISIHNVVYIKETQAFLESYPGLQVEYHCAIPNKRIKTFDDADYYVANDDYKRLLAAEFFYEQFQNSENEQKKRQNFANYYFLKNSCKQRLNTCDYRNRDITIDENLNLSLCATASDIIGNLNNSSASALINSKDAQIVGRNLRKYCKTCGHYSYHPLNIFGKIAYLKELLKNDFLYEYYEYYSMEKSFLKIRKLTRLYLRITKRTLVYTYRNLWK